MRRGGRPGAAVLSLAALALVSCASAPSKPVRVAPPHVLDVEFAAPACHPKAVPEAKRFQLRPWESLRGCFPLELTGAGDCEWACVVVISSPCGNGYWANLKPHGFS